jgi:hypothetical protein
VGITERLANPADPLNDAALMRPPRNVPPGAPAFPARHFQIARTPNSAPDTTRVDTPDILNPQLSLPGHMQIPKLPRTQTMAFREGKRCAPLMNDVQTLSP